MTPYIIFIFPLLKYYTTSDTDVAVAADADALVAVMPALLSASRRQENQIFFFLFKTLAYMFFKEYSQETIQMGTLPGTLP